MNDTETKAESEREGSCYKRFCNQCKTSNPNTCSIAINARLEEQHGRNWMQDYAAYRVE